MHKSFINFIFYGWNFLDLDNPAYKKVTCCDQDNCNGAQNALVIQTSIVWIISLVICLFL